ncbi:MAG: M14 family zinc carboxypeptidase [Bacteroidales bacterium]
MQKTLIYGSLILLLLLPGGGHSSPFFPDGKTEYTNNAVPLAVDYFGHRGEIYFSFPLPEPDLLKEIGHRLSVDRLEKDSVYAYADRRGFEVFLSTGIPFQVLTPPGKVEFDLNMKGAEALRGKDLSETWDFYPTYEAYIDLMYRFEEEFPDLVRIVEVGETVMGRQLLFAAISPDAGRRRPVPQFMYTASIHGDEPVGFILSLRLIHYLLDNYGTDPEVTWLIDNVDIWISPNENPDGTYRDDNSSILGASRGNANWVDLNRNYPNPVENPPTDQQVETTAMIGFTDTIPFVMSANMHTGIELVNFPYDSWKSHQRRHPDHDWWEFVMNEYVDTVHQYSPSGYMTGMGDGVTHGGDWYVVYGSRQDYFNYFRSCREFTLEMSDQKIPEPELLPDLWEYNYRSLIHYIRQATFGIHGFVYDNETGQPLKAKLSIPGHDSTSTVVWSSLPFGDYHRPLLAGDYNLRFDHPDYEAVEIRELEAVNYERVRLNVALGEEAGNRPVALDVQKEGEGKVFPFEGVQYFTESSNAHLSAFATEGWEFEKWVIDGSDYPDEQVSFIVREGMDIRAVFKESNPVRVQDPELTLTGLSLQPNPLAPTSELVLGLGAQERLNIRVYDLTGKPAGHIFNGVKPPGEHRFPLTDLYTGLRPGVYLLTVEGDGKYRRVIRLVRLP